MAIATRPVEYSPAGTAYEGLLAIDDAVSGERPAVLVAHAWAGRGPVEEFYARRIVELGYAGFALDVARTGADVKGVASFHGLFGAPGNTKGRKIKAKVIAFHGWDDPMVKPDDVRALGAELTEAGADWRINAYGGVMHAFTNPNADDPSFGAVYDIRAAESSWESFKWFLAECCA